MPTLQVLATRPLSGKTALAVGLGQGLARAGSRIRFLRAGSGQAAAADAITFASYFFATSSGLPVPEGQPSVEPNETLVYEDDAGAIPLAAAAAIIVTRGSPDEADIALGRALGDRLIGSIATAVPMPMVETVARDLTNNSLRPLAIITEDRALAAPCVAEIRDCLQAHLLYEGDNDLDVVEDILLAPVYADPAQPHFLRFASKAVLAPFNKTDLHLAAIETQAACLVITGGHNPSPYVLDRAQHGTTTVLLTGQETPETLAALSDVWLTSRFRGERKAAAIAAHLDGHIDFQNLARKLVG